MLRNRTMDNRERFASEFMGRSFLLPFTQLVKNLDESVEKQARDMSEESRQFLSISCAAKIIKKLIKGGKFMALNPIELIPRARN
jgi:hypothetical protein